MIAAQGGVGPPPSGVILPGPPDAPAVLRALRPTSRRSPWMPSSTQRTLLLGAVAWTGIHRAAGPELLRECRRLGDARPATPGDQRLSAARNVHHSRGGPVWRAARGRTGAPRFVYRRAIEIAVGAFARSHSRASARHLRLPDRLGRQGCVGTVRASLAGFPDCATSSSAVSPRRPRDLRRPSRNAAGQSEPARNLSRDPAAPRRTPCQYHWRGRAVLLRMPGRQVWPIAERRKIDGNSGCFKVRSLRVRAVRVPMQPPHRTASGVVAESPLVLTMP